MALNWLQSEIHCEGQRIRPPLDPTMVKSRDLRDICLRMHLILDSIEFTRCEGRLISLDIFDSIDQMHSDLLRKDTIPLSDWRDCIERFGDYYGLNGSQPIEVSPRSVKEIATMAQQLGIELLG